MWGGRAYFQHRGVFSPTNQCICINQYHCARTNHCAHTNYYQGILVPSPCGCANHCACTDHCTRTNHYTYTTPLWLCQPLCLQQPLFLRTLLPNHCVCDNHCACTNHCLLAITLTLVVMATSDLNAPFECLETVSEGGQQQTTYAHSARERRCQQQLSPCTGSLSFSLSSCPHPPPAPGLWSYDYGHARDRVPFSYRVPSTPLRLETDAWSVVKMTEASKKRAPTIFLPLPHSTLPSIASLPHKRFLVGCSPPFMRLAKPLTALRAWCKQYLPGR